MPTMHPFIPSLFLLSLIITLSSASLGVRRGEDEDEDVTPTTSMTSTSTFHTKVNRDSSRAGCPLQTTPTGHNSSLQSPCDPIYYQKYGILIQAAFYSWALTPGRSPSLISTLLAPLMANYSQDDCLHSVSSKICNSQSSYFNEPLQCHPDKRRCECLWSDTFKIFTRQEMGTHGCLGVEGSICWDKGDPNLVAESRSVGLLCGYGAKCVDNTCRQRGWKKGDKSLAPAKHNSQTTNHVILLFLLQTLLNPV